MLLVVSCAIANPLGGNDILVSWFGFSSVVDMPLLSTGLSWSGLKLVFS